ncbi:cytidylate kinase/pantoate--beta-alanine ligase [Rubidibacter lacunae KORDI 51-2]|uniref:Bifunctional pantoate ligase/cytidylate kinase n=1 Tax=Rubidibacter lacunae KORDI 51-2 TaxID=582515 RepID=U5DA54_9CHRO|nr:bifunctional pantoate--beta-alanine ligase/(d)CMP kinase [Rubidibacter lacunae]ERN41463.1 cytidylate kinase/pantoate--beta-alanine ligase [Rubidibacter lacunae KORDI 51-2]
MRLFKTVAGLRCELARVRQQGDTVGFVPTMGALHAGHDCLIERAIAETDCTVVSIFVNPLQFEPGSDFERYPRDLVADCCHCEHLGARIIFAPEAGELYGNNADGFGCEAGGATRNPTRVLPPPEMLRVLCAPYRPGHFEGVADAVIRLLNIVQPDTAYFGEKDAQQLAIVRLLASDLKVPVDIRSVETVREPSGLACSSRNRYLTSGQRAAAAAIAYSLNKACHAFGAGERNSNVLASLVKRELATVPELRVEYVELVHPQTLAPLAEIADRGLLATAVYLGDTRLIDNVLLRQRRPVVAIDGPAGAGKSTVTRRVASKLGLLHLDTGAMYRAVTWLVLETGVALDDEARVVETIAPAAIELVPAATPDEPARTYINGKDVTEAIRTTHVTQHVSQVSALPAVRRMLVARQQRYGDRGGIVAEGRDIGTHVFPDAELKIFLTASLPERARRRARDLEQQGRAPVDLAQLEGEIARRDDYDRSRAVAPLTKADDAIELLTDNLSLVAVVDRIAQLYRQHLVPPSSSEQRSHRYRE